MAPNGTLAIVASVEQNSESLITANAGKTHPLKTINHLLCRARRRQTEGVARLCLLFANKTNIVLKETLDTLCIRKFVLYGNGWGEARGG